MFVGFNAKIKDQGIIKTYSHNHIKKWFDNQKRDIQDTLASYISDEGVIDESRLEEDWFPNIDADVFISHSHKDQDLAIHLAGWLYSNFDITSFIDSCVWGYADDLLRKIDNEYCVNKRKSDGSIDSYSYEKRNQSTAHVHMILTTALHKMIDNAECLIFLNTPNALPINEVISSTLSPWIYSELAFSQSVRKKSLSEYRQFLQHDGLTDLSALKVKYDITFDHLVDLNDQDLLYLMEHGKRTIKISSESLDCLYEYKGIIGDKNVWCQASSVTTNY